MRRTISVAVLLTAVLVVLPGILSLIGGGYWTRVATTIGVFSILTMSANLVTGTTGLMSLGHAGFYGIGAYTAGLLATKLGWPLFMTLPASGVITAVFGILLALPTMRLIGIYFAVATLGLGEIIHVTLLNWVDFTRGPMGISGIPGISIQGLFTATDMVNYYAVAIVALITALVLGRLTHSYYGNALRAVREDDQCAASMGLNVVGLKIQSFAFACFFAGIAGALWAHTTGYISPGDFRFSESILILAMIVVGGLGSLPGAVLGAIILLGLPEFLRPIGDYRMIVVGAVMFFSILFLPRGLLGETSMLTVIRRQFGLAWDRKSNLGWRQ